MVVRVVKASNLSGGSVAAYVVVELDEPGQRWGHTAYLATSDFSLLKMGSFVLLSLSSVSKDP